MGMDNFLRRLEKLEATAGILGAREILGATKASKA
jgi:hypothetical protein